MMKKRKKRKNGKKGKKWKMWETEMVLAGLLGRWMTAEVGCLCL